MAIAIIERDLKKAIADYSDRKLRTLLNKTEIHEITITDTDSAEAFVQGTTNVMRGARYTEAEISAVNTNYNTIDNWKTTVNNIYSKLNSLPLVTTNHNLRSIDQLYNSDMQGVYLLSSSSPSAMVIRLYNKKGVTPETGDTNLDTFLAAYRRLAWNSWRDTFLPTKSRLRGISVEKGQGRGTQFRRLKDPEVGPIWDPKGKDHRQIRGEFASAAFGRGNPFAHDHESTVGSIGLQRILEQLAGDEGSQELQEALQYRGLERISRDIVQDVKETLQIEFIEEEIDLPNGNTRARRVIRGKLRKQGKELSDWDNIKQQILKPDGSLATVIKKTVAAMNEQQALAAEGSKSIKKRVGEKTAKIIVSNLTKKGRKTVKVKKQPKYKKPAPKKVKVQNSGTKARTKKKINIGINIAGKKLRRPEQTKRKETQSVLKIRALINKRLPAEVRRNMGRPALINRTGNFSNSVQLLNINQAKTGLTGDYTYTRSGGGSRPPQPGVYQTFENSGRWPAGYNPKDLITKSIRNLAVQYTTQKFVQLRRQ